VTRLWFVEFAMLALLTSISLMVAITVSVKAMRAIRRAWYKSHFRSIEPALENYLLSGEPQSDLERLRPWQRDRFLSSLMVERIALLKGQSKESLVQLAADLELVERYLKALGSCRRWRRARAAENLGYFGGAKAAGPVSALLTDFGRCARAIMITCAPGEYGPWARSGNPTTCPPSSRPPATKPGQFVPRLPTRSA
jgi:hypothetical protein